MPPLNKTLQQNAVHVYEAHPSKDKRGADLVSDVLPFGRLLSGEPNAAANAIGYAEHFSRSHDAVIRVYDDARNVIETHQHTGDFKQREPNDMKQKAAMRWKHDGSFALVD